MVGKDKTCFILFLELCKNYGWYGNIIFQLLQTFLEHFQDRFLTKKTKQKNHQNGGTFYIFDMNILGYC